MDNDIKPVSLTDLTDEQRNSIVRSLMLHYKDFETQCIADGVDADLIINILDDCGRITDAFDNTDDSPQSLGEFEDSNNWHEANYGHDEER